LIAGPRCLLMFSASRYGEVEGNKVGEFQKEGDGRVGEGAGIVYCGGNVAGMWRD